MKEDIDILIVKFLGGNIMDEEKNRLIAWYNQSDENKIRFAQLKNIQQVAHPAFRPEDIDVTRAEIKVLKQIGKKTNTSSGRLWGWVQKIAAVLFIPMLLLSLYLWANSGKLKNPQTVVQEISALPGTRSKVNLPDGSEVWLNSGSTLSYSLPFNIENRKTTLSGEGYFKVKTNKKHPFFVSANGWEVVATGTQFNVEAYPDDSLGIVTLVEGKVAVIAETDKKIDVAPNHRLSLNMRTGEYKLDRTDAALYGSWKEGILAFRDETLENVFKRIGRTFNVDIQMKDSRLAEHKYRATFEGESLQQILDVIQLSAPIKYNFLKNNANDNSIEIIEVCYK